MVEGVYVEKVDRFVVSEILLGLWPEWEFGMWGVFGGGGKGARRGGGGWSESGFCVAV